MMELLFIFTVFALSAGTTAAVLRYARTRDLLDIPNSRSSHSIPTPRGGGIAVVFITLTAWISGSLAGWFAIEAILAVSLGGLLIAAAGLIDDFKDVPASWRFGVHVVGAAIVIHQLGGITEIQVGELSIPLGYAGYLIGATWVVWLLNLYNFMDGIDGIAAVQAVTSSFSVAACMLVIGDPQFALIAAVVGASALGFLVFNWPPARIFMGDVGSSFIGFVFGALALASHNAGALSIWVWLVILAVFIVDATVTLLVRIGRRERWYAAHRSHSYQKASRRFGAHKPVTLVVGSINLLWLFPLAVVASLRPDAGWWITITAWTPLVALACWLGAGRPDEDQ